MQMEFLPAKTPEMVLTEFYVHLLAYHLIRTVQLEIIRNWLRQQTQIEENAALESKKEQTLEAAYREYYAHAEEDLRIVRNMHNAQMRAFKRSRPEKN